MKLNRFARYQQNLGWQNVPAPSKGSNGRNSLSKEVRVYSYGTHVATQHGDSLVELGYHSVTTRKHVNYAADQLGLRVQHCES